MGSSSAIPDSEDQTHRAARCPNHSQTCVKDDWWIYHVHEGTTKREEGWKVVKVTWLIWDVECGMRRHWKATSGVAGTWFGSQHHRQDRGSLRGRTGRKTRGRLNLSHPMWEGIPEERKYITKTNNQNCLYKTKTNNQNCLYVIKTNKQNCLYVIKTNRLNRLSVYTNTYATNPHPLILEKSEE